jgi:hypothetical protein
MQSVFHIHKVNKKGEIDTTTLSFNLLDSYTQMKAQTIRASNRLYKSFSSEHLDLENLAWTQELILDSCDGELK